VRWFGITIAVLVTATAHAAPTSNPAFLGISMANMGAGCFVRSVTKGSAAQDAGLRQGDVIVTMDKAPTRTCDDLRDIIVGHPSGDQVSVDVLRGGERLVLKILLTTRAEVLHRRLVSHPMESTDLVDLDNAKHSYDLGDQHGHTTVVGWFLDTCFGCARLLDRVHDAMVKRSRDTNTPPLVLGVASTLDPRKQLEAAAVRKSFSSSIALAFADADVFDTFAINDGDRATFMVIDCKGVVQFVAPIAPESEDLDDAIAEVLSAAEQAEHARTSRR
jgi:hypothetical protein